MRARIAFSLLLGLVAPAWAASSLPGGGISEQALDRHVRVLASDAYAGRAPATSSEQKTLDYLITQFKRDGLEPGGDDGGWTQNVTLVRAQLKNAPTATLHIGSDSRALVNGQDVTLQSLYPSDHIVLKDAPLVFVGYGVDAPERHWDDYKGVDLKGKVAVVLINDPDFETPKPGAFDGKGMTYYGRWTYKYEELARRGAAGVLIVHETVPAAYGWATVRSSGTSALFDIPRSDAAQYHTRLRGWMQRAVAEDLFKRVGLDFDAVKASAQRADFHPVPLGKATLSADLEVQRDTVTTHNVVAKLTGAKKPDETVIYSAHWDAFGVGTPDQTGDAIRHGAVDNATGVAAVLELARVFAAGPKPARTVMFIAFTSEEKGLLGASYYAAHPLAPLDKTAAVINIEMLNPDGPTHDIVSWGRGRVSLEQSLAAAAKGHGKYYRPDPKLEAGFFYRADHFAFAQKGVPAITVGAGMDMVDGGIARGQALSEQYFANCYHQPCDKVTASWNALGQAQDATILYDLGLAIANDGSWPAWDADSEFSARRQQSAAARDH